jgi:phosphatidylserine/phosphatidylglycerophosphate/cardiolipin synthase-like enzyme
LLFPGLSFGFFRAGGSQFVYAPPTNFIRAESVVSRGLCWRYSGIFFTQRRLHHRITNEIGKAKTTVLVQAYSFTSAPIANALVDAHKRGVKVQVVLDSSQRTEKYSSADFIRNAGITCLIDDAHAIAHNKVVVIDGQTVITGSFNFTKAAEEKNAENLLIIHDPALAAKYTTNWTAHAKHSTVYRGKTK